MISIYCNSNKLVNRSTNALRSSALMSRRNNVSKSINHHYNNNNMQSSIRSFSYNFDPPKSCKVSLGVGLGLATGILIGGFGIHVDVSPEDNSLGISVGPPGTLAQKWYQQGYQQGYQKRATSHNHLAALAFSTANAVLNQKAPEIAAERYLVSYINLINVDCLDNPNDPDFVHKNGLLQTLKKDFLPHLKRLVHVKGDKDDEFQVYELLEDDGLDSCLVKGPLQPGKDDKGNNFFSVEDSYEDAKVITVKRDDVYSRQNSPVECHGLVGDKSHLNGKLGTLIGHDSEEGLNILISFEDVSIGRVWVPRQNVRGVVNLPLFRDFDPFPMVPSCAPVVCQGLVSDHEKHLNNKRGTALGDVDANYNTTVVFEESNIPDTKVHVKNLFLSIELPKSYTPSTRKSKDK